MHPLFSSMIMFFIECIAYMCMFCVLAVASQGEHVCLWEWLISLSIMICCWVHFVAHGTNLFFFMDE